jgi:hypothetical protein
LFWSPFSPLGIMAGISIVLIINFEYLTLGKLLKETRELGYDWYEKELAKESKGVLKSLRSTVGWVIFICGLLFSLFVIIITIVFPILVPNIYWRLRENSRDKKNFTTIDKPKTELRESSTSRNKLEVENPIRS